jgi:catechol 2,3-dioxygenase-like lactoylglutathione lyase family enzyme
MSVPMPEFTGLHFFVRNMPATVEFYRRLGFDVPDGDVFTRLSLPNGITFAYGSDELTRGYDPDWQPRSAPGSCALQFDLPSRDAVNALHAAMVGHGYRSHLAPLDAFWGSRYAELLDPDGNVVGFHSPRDETMVSPPPA